MKALISTAIITVIVFVAVAAGTGNTASYSVASYTIDDVTMPTVSAKAWGIFDTQTGKLLLAHDAAAVYPIASVTKLMTAAVAVDMLDIEATTTVSWRAVATEGRAGRLSAGDVLTLRELLFPLLIESSNDAAEVFAEQVKREAFIAAMNEKAAALDMRDTTFVDPSGLAAGNTSSVLDVMKLITALTQEHQFILDVSTLDTYIGTDHTWRNNNPVAGLSGYRGGKHGFTDEANRTLAAVFAAPLANDTVRDVTIVLLGSDDIAADVQTLHTLIATYVHYQ